MLARPPVSPVLESYLFTDVNGSTVSAAYRELAVWWLLSRIIVFGSALAVGVTGWPHHISAHGLGLLTGWDGAWYREIASSGYHAGSRDVSFFPLLPLILTAFARAGVPMTVTGLVAANAAFAAALAGLYVVCRSWLPEPDARRAAIYFAIFPMSFVFSMAYPESLAVAASIAAALAARSGRWPATAASGSLAALARPLAVLVALPVRGLAAGRGSFSRRERAPAIASVAAPLVAVVGFWTFLWASLGDPRAWSQAERAWGRSVHAEAPLDALRQVAHAPYSTLGDPPFAVAFLLRDVALTVIYLVLLAVAARCGVPRVWIAYGALLVAVPLLGGTFTSMGRYGLVAFPAFAGLACLGRQRAVDVLLRIVSLVLLSACVVTLVYRYP
jgi:hypothetical protein